MPSMRPRARAVRPSPFALQDRRKSLPPKDLRQFWLRRSL